MSKTPEHKTEEAPEAKAVKNAVPLRNSTTRKKFWSADKFLSLLAFLISLGTFVTFAYQTYLIQKQQYANVMPYLLLRIEEDRQNNRINSSALKLVNNGIGPAFIRDISIWYQDSMYYQDPAAFFNNFTDPDSTNYSTLTIGFGDVIPAGGEVFLIETKNEYSAALLDNISREAILEITYASIYDEMWKITSDAATPKKIE
ncbi:MAG: hypothetical protein RIG62_19685 [Cyclobacteriaceae bacterium]|jgi:hypothetical protein